MMKLKIEITIDNAAFEPDKGFEAARILRELADEIDGNNWPPANWDKRLQDVNGNAVGKAKVTR